MKLFKTVFLVGLATIALGSAAMGDNTTPPTGPNPSEPCTAAADVQGNKPVQGTGGQQTAPANTNANGAQNN